MLPTTNIEYAEHTWNAFVGCLPISDGCLNCYAQKIAFNLAKHGNTKVRNKYAGLTNSEGIWNGKVRRENDDKFFEPINIRVPKIIFVNSMSDIFFDKVPDEWIERVFQVIKKAKQHIFLVQTKYAENMFEFCNSYYQSNQIIENLCLGVSVESSEYLERVEYLISTPSVMKWINVEPYLQKTDFNYLLNSARIAKKPIDWLVSGGESSKDITKARPSHLEDFVDLQEQCKSNDVAFFLKQLGTNPLYKENGFDVPLRYEMPDSKGATFESFPEHLQTRDYPKKFHQHFKQFEVQQSLF